MTWKGIKLTEAITSKIQLGVSVQASSRKRDRPIHGEYGPSSLEELERRELLSVVSALSFRSGPEVNDPIISSVYAGQTVYIRIDAPGAAAGTQIPVSIYEDDLDVGNDDLIGTATATIVNGVGFISWKTAWQGNDGLAPWNLYYAFYDGPLLDNVYSGQPDQGHFHVKAPQGQSNLTGATYSWVGDSTPVTISRLDKPGSPIQGNLPTWVVIHGRDASANSSYMIDLENAVKNHADGAQVLTVDWQVGAKSSGLTDFGGERFIPAVAQWVANFLTDYGFSNSNLNFIGHSWGAVISGEIAARIPGGANRIVALDPAMDATDLSLLAASYFGSISIGVNAVMSLPYDTASVNFSAHSQSSLALVSSFYGSEISASTADDTFLVDLVGPTWINPESHVDAVTVFTNMLNTGANGAVSGLFSLASLGRAHPWTRNRFDPGLGIVGTADEGSGDFEGILQATGSGSSWSNWTIDTLTIRDARDHHEVLLETGATTIPLPNIAGKIYPFGQAVSLSSTLMAAVKPFTGQVAVFDSLGDELTLSTVSSNGKLALTIAGGSIAPATYACYLAYGGDANHNPAYSPVFQLVIDPAPTSMALKPSASQLFYGLPLTLTTVVNSSTASGLPRSGSVTFTDGGSVIGTVPIVGNSAEIVIPSPPVGTHSYSASYSGDSQFKPSNSNASRVPVSKVPMLVSLIPSGGGPPQPGQPVSITVNVAVVSGTATPQGSVTFKEGSRILGTSPLDGSGNALLSTSLLAGHHAITARYSGDANTKPASLATELQVQKAATSVAISADSAEIPFGTAVSFSVLVQAISPSVNVPKGKVRIQEGGLTLATVVLSGGMAVWSPKALLARGVHLLIATYLGDANDLVSTSLTWTETIT